MLTHILAFSLWMLVTPAPQGQTSAVPSSTAQPAQSLQQALEDYRAGKFDSAIEKYQAILQQDANSGDAYAGLARTYLKQQKVDQAFDTATKGVAQVPASLAAHSALGEVYFRQAKMPESEKEFLIGVNASNPDARACLGLSRLYTAYSLHARARKMLERAHELDASDPEIRRRWMGTRTRQEQIEWLEKYLASASNDDQRELRGLQTRLEFLKDRAAHTQPGCQLVSKLTSTEAPLKAMMIDPTHLHGFGLLVKVNGQSSKLLLDTGASGLLINKRLAEKAGIERRVESKSSGIGDKGDMDSYIGYADSIKIGDLEFQHCAVEVSEKRSILDDDGLIGADVFGHYLVTIDFLSQKLKLEELPQRPGDKAAPLTLASQHEDEGADEASASKDASHPQRGEDKPANTAPQPASGPQDRYIAPEMANYSKVFRFGHELLIPTTVGKASPKLFLIDTGAMMNTISPEAGREVTKVHGDSDIQVRGISGSVKNVYTADKAILQFSHFRQENQDLVAFDLSGISRGTGTEVSGILGFTTLRLFTIKIDYRDGLVDFVYAGPKQ